MYNLIRNITGYHSRLHDLTDLKPGLQILPLLILFCFGFTGLYSQSHNPVHQATFSIQSAGDCDGLLIIGTYESFRSLGEEERVMIQAEVTDTGRFVIETNSVNGYRFSASGVFYTRAKHVVVLMGSGVPVAGQTDTFQATGSNGGGTCSFSIVVKGWECGMKFIDQRDSQAYKTIQIGSQCWMAQNLNFGKQTNYMWVQKNDGVPEKYCYLGNYSNCVIYGGLYQWDELMQYEEKEGGKGLCPEGWHVPSDAEWCTLTTYVDPKVDCQSIGASGNEGGGDLKAQGTTFWAPPNDGATNASEFAALPGGHRDYPGSFSNRSYVGFFWSSTACGPAHAWIRSLHYFDNKVNRDDYVKSNGFSARCIKDSPSTP